MDKLHLALGVADIEQTVTDYSERLGLPPEVIIPGAYALWRTPHLNVSVRKTSDAGVGKLRHLGWETEAATSFTSEVDCNGIVWERFNADHQREEIAEAFIGVGHQAGKGE